MKKILPILLILSVSLSFSQNKLKKADRLFDSNAFLEAAMVYEDYIRNTIDVNSEIYAKAADAFYFTNQRRNAVTYYEQAYKINGNTLQEPYLSRYVRSLRSVREYDKANEIYLKYLNESGDSEKIKKFKDELQAFQEILDDDGEPRFSLKNLEINTPYSDFGASLFGNQIVFSSARPGASKALYAWNEQPYLSLFVADVTEGGELINEKLLSNQMNNEFHEATLAISPDSVTVYFTSSNINRNRLVLDESSRNHFKLYRGTYSDNKITNIEPLFFNSDKYSVGHPAVSPDGNYLFFASDMPGGYGGADIYYSVIYEDGMLSTPKNAGPVINTSGNDFFPFFIDNTLYFSSDGHVGFGGLDLFESTFSEEEASFSTPVNLGKVANTPYDDFAIMFNNDRKTGYLSSNRPGGKGDDDLYFFYRAPLPCDQFISGNVTDKLSGEKLTEVSLAVRDTLNRVIATVETDENGYYEILIPCDTKVEIIASKPEYVDKTKESITGSIDREYTKPVDFELDKISDLIVKDEETGVEKINLDTIYFEFDSAVVTEDSKKVLDKAVEVMNMFPNMIIKIESHTDSRGSHQYNLNLSDRRAKSTQDYLYQKGIAQERILSATGFGEERLLNHCADGVRCSDEEHELNRRSDFIIVER